MFGRRTSPRPPAAPLSEARTGWLIAVAGCGLLPHAAHLPGWLNAVALLLFIWRLAQWRLGWPGAGTTVKLLVVIACCAGVTLTFGRLFGREPGVALLTLLLVLKLHELHSVRDGHTVVLLGYFMLLAAFLYSQSPGTAALLFAAMVVITAALIALTGPPAPPTALLRHAGRMLLQALPFMLVLFVLFPRVPGPLWGLPLDAFSGRSGLSDSMSPGSISELSLSGEIAFRVHFDNEPPPARDLYWRGPVLTEFDGRTWRPGDSARRLDSALPHAVNGTRLHYEVTLEPHGKNWLFALETVAGLPAGARISDDWQVFSGDGVRNRRRDRFESVLAVRPGTDEAAPLLEAARRLPAGGNPRTRALARQLHLDAGSDRATVDAALALFRREAFVYTLTPPLLGTDGVNEFLFDTRRGFCEHYAGAFVFLMRAAGLPARVVTGYQGGERNSFDDYIVVRQSDAHAWAEVWLPGEGWLRVEPDGRHPAVARGTGPVGPARRRARATGRTGGSRMAARAAPARRCRQQCLEPVGAFVRPAEAAGIACPPRHEPAGLAFDDGLDGRAVRAAGRRADAVGTAPRTPRRCAGARLADARPHAAHSRSGASALGRSARLR